MMPFKLKLEEKKISSFTFIDKATLLMILISIQDMQTHFDLLKIKNKEEKKNHLI
jgi:hypothetical protein